MSEVVTPVPSNSCLMTTALITAGVLTVIPSGLEKAVLSVWYLSTAIGKARMTTNGSRGRKLLPVGISMGPSGERYTIKSKVVTKCQ